MEKVLIGFFTGLIIMVVFFIYNKGKDKIDEIRLDNNPTDPKMLFKFALKEMDNGNYQEAKKYLEKIEDKNSISSLSLAICYQFTNDFDKAASTFEPIFQTTQVYSDIANYAKAQDMDSIQKLNELNILGMYCYGHLKHMKGDEEDAEKWKNEVLQIKPDLVKKFNWY